MINTSGNDFYRVKMHDDHGYSRTGGGYIKERVLNTIKKKEWPELKTEGDNSD